MRNDERVPTMAAVSSTQSMRNTPRENASPNLKRYVTASTERTSPPVTPRSTVDRSWSPKVLHMREYRPDAYSAASWQPMTTGSDRENPARNVISASPSKRRRYAP